MAARRDGTLFSGLSADHGYLAGESGRDRQKFWRCSSFMRGGLFAGERPSRDKGRRNLRPPMRTRAAGLLDKSGPKFGLLADDRSPRM
jgi:hypothetical protein